MISSPHNPQLKHVRALAGRSKDRRAAGAYLVEGVRLVEALLDSGQKIESIYYSDDASNRAVRLIQRLELSGYGCEAVLSSVFKTICETETSQGILAVVKIPMADSRDMLEDDLILVPDQIRDPGNLGTLLRSAVAAGVTRVIIPPETVDPYAPKVVRSAMGAHFSLEITPMEWDRIQEALSGYVVYLAAADGEIGLWQADFHSKTAIIIGGEAEGAGTFARTVSNVTVSIPMKGKIESLNAGVAGSIILFEVLRQRSENK